MQKWQARVLALVLGGIWLFGLMFVEGILLMSGAHADDSGQMTVLVIGAIVAVLGIGFGGWLVSVIWRSWRSVDS